MVDTYWKILLAAFQSIFLHKLRSGLSILGVVCGVMAVLTMISIGEGAKKEVLEGIRKLGTTLVYVRSTPAAENRRPAAAPPPANGLTLSDRDRIQAGCPYISAIAAFKEFTADIFTSDKHVSGPVMACSADFARILGLRMQQGRFLKEMDVDAGAKVCIIGRDVAGQMPAGAGIGSRLRIGDHLFTIVGSLGEMPWEPNKKRAIAQRNYNEILFIPLGLERLFSSAPVSDNFPGSAELSELVIDVADERDVAASAAIVKRILETAHEGTADYEIIVPRELLIEAQKAQRTFNLMLAAVAGISLLVGGIGVMNIMLASVSERTREIGIRRAVGAARPDIVVQFLAESVLMTFIGGIIGVLLGVGTVCLISFVATWQMVINAWAVFLPLALSIGVGLFFGIFPAIKAARMEPINALRHHG